MKCEGFDCWTGAYLRLEGERTIQVVDELIQPPESGEHLAPGFIDVQVNGFAGVDYNNPAEPHERIAASLDVMFSTGVTRLFPTVITGSPDNMLNAARNLAQARKSLPRGRAMEAIHMEGPHISPEDGPRGAHPRQWTRPPDVDEFRRWQDATEGAIRLVTMSPEWPGSTHYIEYLTGHGVVVSIGHTKATRAQLDDAVKAGATMSTHLGNGAHSEMRRHPNYLWDQLAEDRLCASFIVDGIHIGDSFLRVALRAKGIGNSVLITDAVMPACSEPGPYKLGEVEVELLPDMRVVLRGGDRLAGSSLRMDRGVENLMRLAQLSLGEAVLMATRNPARAGRIPGRQRGLAAGERMDLVRFAFEPQTKSIQIFQTWLDGELVYSA